MIYMKPCFQGIIRKIFKLSSADIQIQQVMGHDARHSLTFTPLWANSADDKLMILILFFSKNRIWHFMQTVSIGDSLHEMTKSVFWEKYKKIFQYVECWKFYPECFSITRTPIYSYSIHNTRSGSFYAGSIDILLISPRKYFVDTK